jgi:hypothetical protein
LQRRLAGFWISHVPRVQLRGFRGCTPCSSPARLPLLDNLWPPGSSTPVSEPDENGDTWQWRTLTDGSRHRVLAKLPWPSAVARGPETLATQADYLHWDHDGPLRWTTADTPPEGSRHPRAQGVGATPAHPLAPAGACARGRSGGEKRSVVGARSAPVLELAAACLSVANAVSEAEFGGATPTRASQRSRP